MNSYTLLGAWNGAIRKETGCPDQRTLVYPAPQCAGHLNELSRGKDVHVAHTEELISPDGIDLHVPAADPQELSRSSRATIRTVGPGLWECHKAHQRSAPVAGGLPCVTQRRGQCEDSTAHISQDAIENRGPRCH